MLGMGGGGGVAVLSQGIPDDEDQAKSHHTAKDDGVAALPQVDLVDQVVDDGEAVGEVVQLLLDHLQGLPLVHCGGGGLHQPQSGGRFEKDLQYIRDLKNLIHMLQACIPL